MSGSSGLLCERRDDVLWLTIDREERRNAISEAVLDGIASGFEQVISDPSIRAVVLTGVGRKAFCAGGDLQTRDPFLLDYSRPFAPAAELFRQSRKLPVPLIARINGACYAGGMGLMAMCDFALADMRAKFALPEVKVGVFPAQVLGVLQRLLPRRALYEMCLTGEPITAERALSLGLINAVGDDVDVLLEALLGKLLRASPAATRRGLYMLKRIESMPFEEGMAFAEGQIALFALTEDAKEGISAFLDKRDPQWPGR